ncbi:hypothetical protein BASA61_007530 [Batrachochytrium salamandrivorans]|nr:hypothetical protein BASA61_007530 [Batrachochytrium salamandrivorans]
MGEYVPIPKFDDPGFALLQCGGHDDVRSRSTYFGGVMILQLDIRIVFDSLFPSGFCGTCGWSSKVKARARILIIALHVCLSLPDYLRIFGFVATIHWQTSSTALQALLISLSSFIQAYLITTWLSKHLGFDTTSPNTRARYIAVVALLILTFVIDLGGIAAYVTSVYLYLQGTQPTFFLSRRVGQFAIICIGIEVITESVTLLNMLHLVCEKQLKSSVATESPDNIDSSEDFPTSIAIPGPPPGSLITTSSPLEMDHLGSQVNSMAFNLIRDNE